MIGHRNDKGLILDKGLAGEDGGRVTPPVVWVGQTLDPDAVPVPVAQVAPQQVALVPHHDAQPGKAGLHKGFDGIVNQRSSKHGHQRFGKFFGQRSQSCARSCGKNHTFHISLLRGAGYTTKAGLAARLPEFKGGSSHRVVCSRPLSRGSPVNVAPSTSALWPCLPWLRG